MICPLASVAFGFRRASTRFAAGEAALGMYWSDPQAAETLESSTWHFAPFQYDRVCVAPLGRATFEPHLVAVYGNSAQVMRLVNAAVHSSGRRVESSFGGRLDCADLVIQTMQMDRAQVVLPCNGDRVFGMTQDTEMAFAFPWSMAGETSRAESAEASTHLRSSSSSKLHASARATERESRGG